MEATSLRLGNAVEWLGDSPFIVSGLKDNGDITIKTVDNDSVNLTMGQSINPIELTEEFLLKCGFKEQRLDSQHWFINKINKKFTFLTNDIGPDGYSEKLEFVYVELRDFGFELVCLKYVHQLQNLYFALTGEELPINLT